MRREDFKEVKRKHILACEWIIKEKGKCADLESCSDCPFYYRNSAYTNSVSDCLSYTGVTSRSFENLQLMKSAKEFLELFEKDFVENENDTNDKINSSKYYKLEGLDIESIDVIFAVVRGINNGVIAGCVSNILKYVMRAEKKNGLEDYKKARKYLDWCIEEKGKEEMKNK